MLPCTSRLDCHPMTFYPEKQTAGKTWTNVFLVDPTLTALWRSLFHSPPPGPGRWNPADTLTQLRERCIVALRLLGGVTLRYCSGLQMTNNDNEDVLQLDDTPYVTLSLRLSAKYKMMEAPSCSRWRTFYADMITWQTQLWISGLFLLQHFYLQMRSWRSWNQQFTRRKQTNNKKHVVLSVVVDVCVMHIPQCLGENFFVFLT